MKKLISFTLFLILVGTVLITNNFIKVGATTGVISSCEDPPTVYTVYSNVTTVTDGTPFILNVTFYNECNQTIKAMKINNVVYSYTDGSISNQGYATYLLPSGGRAYRVQMPMVYDHTTMGTTFTITDFIYSYWDGMTIMPIDYTVSVNSTIESPNIFTTTTFTYPSDPTSPPITYVVTMKSDGTGIVITDENTGESENILFDTLFYSSLYVNAVGDIEEFINNPAGSILVFVTEALDNYSSSTTLTDWASDTILDTIMNDDGITDIFLNRATEYVAQQIQTADPTYVFPGDYMWINGQFQEVIVDEDGNVVLDDDGNPVVDSDGNTVGEPSGDLWHVADGGWLQTALENFAQVVLDKTGLNINLIPIVEWMVNNWGFMLISLILLIIIIMTWPISSPILLWLLMLIPKTLIFVFQIIRSLMELAASRMYTKNTKKAKF